MEIQPLSTMPYTAEISRLNPTCILFLLDQSGSMADAMSGAETGAMKRKADAAANVINKSLQELVLRCARGEGVRDYFHIGVLGYGQNVGPAFGGSIAGREVVPIKEIADSPARVEQRTKKVDDGAGGLAEQTVKFPVWFDSVANGGTPMCQVLEKAKTIVAAWAVQHSTGFPPIVINVTDGESTDGDPSGLADAIKAISTTDGGALLFNVHLSSAGTTSIEYPESDANLPDDFAKSLFRMSSPLTETMQTFARQKGYTVSAASKCFVFNASLASLIDAIDIGTRPSNLR